ncbi:hypothetical protein EX895_004016 [Sporisorium graminicola]|uniref:Uncharacterized protein n=1 Tax=Sporisorium graminicola TaxID=280036 RepID=A0A4V6ETN6_9BASI|nr:hypothetical protein EX895_004016 [Sporisorium graminicola]TKY87339.1 hypothetical protein EX895_004016 [Sporisorium graminicola]
MATPSTMNADPEVIFNAIPPSAARSFLVLLIVMCMCLGASTIELFNHIRFDLQLLRKPGWTKPAKLSSRVAYLCCRYLSVLCLLLVVLFLSLKFDNCQAVPWTFSLLSLVLLNSVTLVLVQRTLALYSWKSNVVYPVSAFYLVVVAASAVCIPFYGKGYRIPGSQFCGYDTRRYLTRTLVANIVYKTLAMALDIVLLLLMLHRLLDGGLSAIWHKKPQQLYSGLADRSLSSFLIRQGVHFYALQLATDIFFVSTYFTLDEPSYQVLGTALVFCIPPIAAAAAFRDMGKKASLVSAKNPSKINEIMNSSNSPSGDNSAGWRGTRLSAAASNGTARVQPSPARVNSYVLQARSNPGSADVAPPEKTTRVSWGGQRQPSHSRQDPCDGVLVTIGTVSQIEEAGEDWQAGSPRYSSDNPDPETLEMQRHWPRLASKTTLGSETAHQSSDGHSSKHRKHVEALGADFEPVPLPTLPRRAAAADDPCLSPLHSSVEAASSSWTPHTPESPYPEVLSPRSFARHSATSENTRSNNVSRPRFHEHDITEGDTSPWRRL